MMSYRGDRVNTDIARWVLQALLVLVFLATGFSRLVGTEQMRAAPCRPRRARVRRFDARSDNHRISSSTRSRSWRWTYSYTTMVAWGDGTAPRPWSVRTPSASGTSPHAARASAKPKLF